MLTVLPEMSKTQLDHSTFMKRKLLIPMDFLVCQTKERYIPLSRRGKLS